MEHMSYAKSISWIDDCRIPFVDDGDKEESYRKPLDTIREGFVKTTKPEYKPQGRFPANILVCDDMLNDGIVYSSGSGDGKLEMININDAHHYNYIDTNRKIKKMTGLQYNDKGTNSRYYDIDKWFNNLLESCG